MPNTVAPQPMPPAALKPPLLAVASTAGTVVPECAAKLLVKVPCPPISMSISQAIMPIQTTANSTAMYFATTRTPRIITPVNTTVRIVEITISSVLSGEVSQPAFHPATNATDGPMTLSM